MDAMLLKRKPGSNAWKIKPGKTKQSYIDCIWEIRRAPANCNLVAGRCKPGIKTAVIFFGTPAQN